MNGVAVISRTRYGAADIAVDIAVDIAADIAADIAVDIAVDIANEVAVNATSMLRLKLHSSRIQVAFKLHRCRAGAASTRLRYLPGFNTTLVQPFLR